MESNHFNYFRVKNFKRFRDLEVKDIGQFNLVLGDNNVGKTSLLEALLYPNSHNIEWFISNLFKCLEFRNFPNPKREFWRYYLPTESYYERVSEEIEIYHGKMDESIFHVSIGANRMYIRPNSYKLHEYGDNFLDDTLEASEGRDIDYHAVESFSSKEIPLIPFQGSFSSEIAEFYLNFMQGNKDLKKRFIKGMNRLFSEIEDIELSLLEENQKTLLVSRADSNYSVPLAFYGEGTIKLTKVLSYLVRHGDKHVLIDEIDTGLYYQRMKDFWKVILETAFDNNTQIFATTHNQECIKAYQEALEELGDDYLSKARTITLKEHPETKDVIAYTNTIDVLQFASEMGNDIR